MIASEESRRGSGPASPKPTSPETHSIGSYLARQRHLRGISLEELAQLTRIPIRSLARLESGSYDGVTDGFVRGFVRTVAESLGLEPEDTVARMLREPSVEDELGSSPSLLFRRLFLLISGLVLLVLVVLGVRALMWGGDATAPEPVEQVFRRDSVRQLAESERAAQHRAEADASVAEPSQAPPSPDLPPPARSRVRLIVVQRLQTEALLLRCVDFSESDRVVHLLTPDSGRVTAMAKGARRSVKRFPGTLDVFNHLRVQIYRPRAGHMARLEQAVLIAPFLPLRAQPARFALACYLLELLDRMAPEGGAQRDTRRLFRFATDALHTIEASEPDLELRTLLELRALDALGLRPEFLRCVRCGESIVASSGPVAFHIGEGGSVCRACEGGRDGFVRVHLGTLRSLEQSLRLDLAKLDRLRLASSAVAEAAQLVGRFQRFHLGLELRSERFLNEILRAGRLTPQGP